MTEQAPTTEPTTFSTGGWLTPVIVAGFTVFWALAIYWLIGTRPTDWQYAVAPEVPGQSVLSVSPVPPGPAPRQVELPSRVRMRMHGM